MDPSSVKLIPGLEAKNTKISDELITLKRLLKYNLVFTLVLFSWLLVAFYFIWSSQQKINMDLLRKESMIEDSFDAVKRTQVKINEEINSLKVETENNNLEISKNMEVLLNNNEKLIATKDYQGKNAENSTLTEEQYLKNVYTEIDQQLEGNATSITEAIDKLDKLYYQNPNSTETLLRLSQAYYYLATSAQAKNDLGKVDYYTTKGLIYVNKSLELNESCVKCIFSNIKTYGLRLDVLGSMTEKFMNMYKIEKDLAKITELDPDFYFLDYYNAVRQLRIAQLPWVQRNFGKLILRNMDMSYNYDDIIMRCKRVFDKVPRVDHKKMKFLMGVAYVLSGDKTTGFELIELAKSMPVVSPMEEIAEKMINEFLQSKKYDYERFKESKMESNSTTTEPIEVTTAEPNSTTLEPLNLTISDSISEV